MTKMATIVMPISEDGQLGGILCYGLLHGLRLFCRTLSRLGSPQAATQYPCATVD